MHGTTQKVRSRRVLEWRDVPGFPEYEVNTDRQVRRKTTQHRLTPFRYILRPEDGMFVELWINRQRYIMSLNSIVIGAFKEMRATA